jgi:hypothetical protein
MKNSYSKNSLDSLTAPGGRRVLDGKVAGELALQTEKSDCRKKKRMTRKATSKRRWE